MTALDGWGEMTLALTAFFASHVAPARPAIRRSLRAHLGDVAYGAIYSLVSLAILGWLIVAARDAPHVQLWDFELWQLWIPNIVMPFVCILTAFGVAAPNPFTIAGRNSASFDPERPGIAGITRHPLLWAITLWALAHMAPNGDLAHLLLFGLFAVFGVVGMAALDGRKRNQRGTALWTERARKTSALPFAALFEGRVRWRDLSLNPLRAIAAFAIYVTLLGAHAHVIGVSPLPDGDYPPSGGLTFDAEGALYGASDSTRHGVQANAAGIWQRPVDQNRAAQIHRRRRLLPEWWPAHR